MNYDPELAALLSQPWSNDACRGYVIAAMERCGFKPSDIEQVMVELYEVFDYTTLQEAEVILSRLVDTFISRISLTMLPVPNPHNTVCVLSGEEARHWQSRSSGYSSS